MDGNRLKDDIERDIFVLEDEDNPNSSPITRIWAPTILDQVFDNLSPTRKNLRDILADLKTEILTGGIGNIVFPVTSVNGKSGGDIFFDKVDLGLGRVDNTRDMDKPLSTPQRSAVMNILKSYNFQQDLQILYDHLNNKNNPHSVTADIINENGVLVDIINGNIAKHNLDTHSNIHYDIRRSLATLWTRVDGIDEGIEDRLGNHLAALDEHIVDENAHSEIFDLKEDIKNKSTHFTHTSGLSNVLYPTTRAVADFVDDRMKIFKETIPNIVEWLSNIKVIDDLSKLPDPSAANYRYVYLSRKGQGQDTNIQQALAICRKDNITGKYFWEIENTGAITKFDPKYFTPNSTTGMTLNLSTLLEDLILAEPDDITGVLNESFLKHFWNKDEADERYIQRVSIIPGDMDGTIKYYVNNDLSSLSDNIRVSGLKDLAFMDWVTEREIRDEAVWNRHMLSRSVDARVLAKKSVHIEHLADEVYTAPQGTVLGNIDNEDGRVSPINLNHLGNLLRPIIDGSGGTLNPDDDTIYTITARTIRLESILGLSGFSSTTTISAIQGGYSNTTDFAEHINGGWSNENYDTYTAGGTPEDTASQITQIESLNINERITRIENLLGIMEVDPAIAAPTIRNFSIRLAKLEDIMANAGFPIGVGGGGSGGGIINMNPNSPWLWEPGVEQSFYDGCRGMRFVGTISAMPNITRAVILEPNPSHYLKPGALPVTSEYFRLLEAGGTWCTDTSIRAWSKLGGSNITGHTFADVSMTENRIEMVSISIGERLSGLYDVWIKYLPGSVDPWLTGEWYDDPDQYKPLLPEPTPNAKIDYKTEQLINLKMNEVYIINGIDYVATGDRINLLVEWFNQIVEIILRGKSLVSMNSKIQHLEIPTRPNRPTNLIVTDTVNNMNNGKIEGTNSTMEFKLSAANKWMDLAIETSTALASGNYDVRYKATTDFFASEIQQVTIN